MSKTPKIILLIVVMIVLLGLGILYYIAKNQAPATPVATEQPWYLTFNPFNNATTTTTTTTDDPTDPGIGQPTGGEDGFVSKFSHITQTAISGVTFFEGSRLIPESETPVEVKIPIKTDTKEGRKEIQKILNTELKINLFVDGVFGKGTTGAIKDFQTLKGIPATGIIDEATSPFFVTIDKSTGPKYETVPSLLYVERMNGHIYNVYLDTKIINKISNSTIPTIYEAFFGGNGKTILYRYLSTDKIINSFVATLGQKNGEFLPLNINDVALSPDKTKLFYLTENSNGITGSMFKFGDTKKTQIFTSSFTEWLPQWATDATIYMTTKPSYMAEGSVFSLDIKTGSLKKIFGEVMGLTTLADNDGTKILYSTSTDRGPALSVFSVKEHSSKDLNLYGLPEKCIWSKDNITIYCAVPQTITSREYPDSWYQGLTSSYDYFVSINGMTGEVSRITSDKEGVQVDATNLVLDKEESQIFFINKKDGTLWGVEIK